MNDLIKTHGQQIHTHNQANQPASQTIEMILDDLCKYGRPHLWIFSCSRKWMARIDMKTTAAGASFEIKATGNTHMEAMEDLQSKVHAIAGSDQ